MKKLIIPILLIGLFAMGFVASSPKDLTPRIIERLKQYLKEYPQEKVYAHTDRDHYDKGETIWIKFYQFHAHYNQPFSLSNVIRLDLINQQGKVLVSTKYPARLGSASGSMRLPKTLPEGHYRLRAYTNWMLNFAHGYIYQKDIFVGSVFSPDISQSNIQELEFYPEGGYLIENIMTKMVVQSSGDLGHAITTSGYILNDQDTLDFFQTSANGLGSFTINPKMNQRYIARILKSDSTFQDFELPQVVRHGFSMNVTNAGVNFLRVMIQSSPKYYGDSVVVTALSQGQIYFAAKGLSNEQPLLINFPKKELPAGICTISVFDEDGIAQSQRSVFIPPIPGYQISIDEPQRVYKTREKVSLKMKIMDQSGNPLKANISISIIGHKVPKYSNHTISDFINLTSELTNPTLNKNLSLGSPDQLRFINQLLVTQPFSRYSWDHVLNGTAPVTSIPVEDHGFTLNGNIMSLETNEPTIGNTVMLSSQDLPGMFRWGVTDEHGNFSIPKLNITGKHQAFLKLNDTLVGDFEQVFVIADTPRVVFPEDYMVIKTTDNDAYSHENQLRRKVQQTYDGSVMSDSLLEANATEDKFYGAPDKTVRLRDFIRLPDMTEIFRELLPGARLRERNGLAEIRVVEIIEDYITGEKITRFQDEGPLLLINNVPVFDPDLIVNLDPELVSSIDIIYGKRSIFGENIFQELPFKGILSFTTNQPILQKKNVKTLHRFEIQGYEKPTNFNHVDASKLPAQFPDLREVLFWNPVLLTDENGTVNLEFYTSDVSGSFIVDIQGITEDGTPIAHTDNFTVELFP